MQISRVTFCSRLKNYIFFSATICRICNFFSPWWTEKFYIFFRWILQLCNHLMNFTLFFFHWLKDFACVRGGGGYCDRLAKLVGFFHLINGWILWFFLFFYPTGEFLDFFTWSINKFRYISQWLNDGFHIDIYIFFHN